MPGPFRMGGVKPGWLPVDRFAFLSICECSVAVANAITALSEHADWVTRGESSEGVGELIHELVASDLEPREANWTRQRLLLGSTPDGNEVRLSPRGPNILIAGPSASGKSSAAKSFLERLTERRYQFCAWMHHLRQGDYTTWFRDCIKDDELAAEAEDIQRQSDLSADESRRRIRETVERRYTLPAAASPHAAEPEAAARQSAAVEAA